MTTNLLLRRAPENVPADVRRMFETPERRLSIHLDDLELRDAGETGDGSYTFTGTAAVFNTVTTLYSGKYWTLQERMLPGAFTNVLNSPDLDVHLNHGHDMKTAIARLTSVGPEGTVKVGGMKLWEDDNGLRVFARLNGKVSTVQDLAVLMADGVIDQMSFAFRIGRETLTTTVEDERETDLWTVEEISELYDVCVCAQGAYPTTSAVLRTALGGLRHAGIDPAGIKPGHDDTESSGRQEVTHADHGGDQSKRAERLAIIRREAETFLPPGKDW